MWCAWPSRPWTSAAAGSSKPPWPPGPQGRSALLGAADPAHRCRTAHRQAEGPPGRPVAVDEHVDVEATWGIYQRMIAAYREPDPARGRKLLQQRIDSVSCLVPAALTEVITLGRTLKKRA